MKQKLSKLARQAQRIFVHTLRRITPRRPHLVISGYPITEGNAIEMLRAAAASYPGRIFWLVPQVSQARPVLDAAAADPAQRVEPIPHRSPAAIWRFATAEATMFTHGLFGNPGRTPGKIMINLWHGGGFKANIMSDAQGRPTITSDFLIASTRRFGAALARECQLPAGGLLLTGNPRVDQFSRAASAPLERVGLTRDQPYLVWMPTFRRNKGAGLTAGWSDVAEAEVDVNQVMADCVQRLRSEFGLTVVVKPHPSDPDIREIPGAVVLTNDTLQSAGVAPYELLGGASGLLTDYSSVWLDYLLLDRPIGFIVPDEDAYRAGRGFADPSALELLPGPRLTDAAAIREFAQDVMSGGAASAARRREVSAALGLPPAPGPGDRVSGRIMRELAERGVFRGPSSLTPPSN